MCHSVFPSSGIVIVFTQMLVVIAARKAKTFVSKICFGLADISQTGLGGNWAVGRMVEASGAVIPVNHGIYFWDLSRLE